MEKSTLHPRNRHRLRYDFKTLTLACPELAPFVAKNKYGDTSIDFADAKAVKFLNKALLKHFYQVGFWDIPKDYLCPPIPGRADYLHYLADLLGTNKKLRGLDIGVGANCVYPLLGQHEYGWNFVGSETDDVAVNNAKELVLKNGLTEAIEIRKQTDSKSFFKNIIQSGEHFDFTICNPPFHESAEAASFGSERKWKNLGKKPQGLNFGGKNTELWCAGGEKEFVSKMIEESVNFAKQCTWFTSLISKEENLPVIYQKLKSVKAREVKTIDMAQGQKKSRFVAWNF